MAINLKRTNLLGDKKDILLNNAEKYTSIWNMLSEHLDDQLEQIYFLIFDDDYNCIHKENISSDAGAGSAVATNVMLVEQIFEALNAGKFPYSKWGLAHNHPPVYDSDGNFVETLVSDGDIIMTKATRQVATDIFEDHEYVGHFIINKEDRYDKIIDLENELKFNLDIIDKLKGGDI